MKSIRLKSPGPKAVEDVTLSELNSSILRVVSKTKNFENLLSLGNLSNLWCFNITEKHLQIISQCRSVKRLYLDGLRTENLAALSKLSLEVLSLEGNSKINTLKALESQSRLKGLEVINFKNLHSVREISHFKELRSLAFSGSMWTRMTIDTLEPISELEHLEELDLCNLKAKDDSLTMLGGLKRLRI